jgi:SAM-dependent methyltransferase
MPLAMKYCVGTGLELGAAAHNRFDLPGAINVAPYAAHGPDRDEFELYAREQEKLCGAYALVDVPTTDHMLPIDSDTQDYVISSHVLEHLPDVIGAWLEWSRVLRDGGIVFMILPLRDALPEDRHRPITSADEFWEDYHERRSVETHPTEGVPGGARGHYHVFTLESVLELIAEVNQRGLFYWEVITTEDIDSKVGNGFTVVCRVHKRLPLEIPAEIFLLDDTAPIEVAPLDPSPVE